MFSSFIIYSQFSLLFPFFPFNFFFASFFLHPGLPSILPFIPFSSSFALFFPSFISTFSFFLPIFLSIFPFHPSHLCCNRSFLYNFLFVLHSFLYICLPYIFLPFLIPSFINFLVPEFHSAKCINVNVVPSFFSSCCLFPFFSSFFLNFPPFYFFLSFFVFTHLSFFQHGDLYLVCCQTHSL